MSKLTPSQELLRTHLQELGYETEPEYRFMSERRFRFDLFSRELNMGFEANGGRYKRGHRSSRDTDKENDKHNLAMLMGYRYLQFTNEAILTGKALEFLREYLRP